MYYVLSTCNRHPCTVPIYIETNNSLLVSLYDSASTRTLTGIICQLTCLLENLEAFENNLHVIGIPAPHP